MTGKTVEVEVRGVRYAVYIKCVEGTSQKALEKAAKKEVRLLLHYIQKHLDYYGCINKQYKRYIKRYMKEHMIRVVLKKDL